MRFNFRRGFQANAAPEIDAAKSNAIKTRLILFSSSSRAFIFVKKSGQSLTPMRNIVQNSLHRNLISGLVNQLGCYAIIQLFA